MAATRDPIAVVASLPCNPMHYTSSLLPWTSFAPRQTLLGGEAQLRLTAAAFDAAGFKVAFMPQPEIFAARPPIDKLARQFGIYRDHDDPILIHARFGSHKSVRVLKPALNVFFTASRRRERLLNMTGNFLLDGRLPSAFERAVQLELYEEFATIDGLEVVSFRAPFGLLEAQDRGAEAGPSNLLRSPGELALQAASFADLYDGAWRGNPSDAGRGTQPMVSDSFRRALLDDIYDLPRREPGAETSRFVLLPFDLDDDASIVPEMLQHLVRFPGLAAARLRVALYPFNEVDNLGRLEETIKRVLGEQWRCGENPCASRLFIVRCRHPVPRPEEFRRLFPAAIVDGNSPETNWTLRRLASLEVETVLLRDRIKEGADSTGATPTRALDFDEERVLKLDDKFGERTIVAGAASPRLTFQAVLIAAELASSPHPSIMPRDRHLRGQAIPTVEAMLGALLS